MVKVSVIIPVYNGQKYLRKCLDSVCAQTLRDIEIICVDDGSTDDSLQILNDYRQNDARFYVLTQQNQYAGVARNNGLSRALGEYVVFWDADDYFAPDALEKLYTCATERNADVCVCDAQDFDSETDALLAHSYVRGPFPEKECFNIEDMQERIYTFTSTVTWNKLIKRSLLLDNHIQFQALKHINDVGAILLVLSCAKRITILNEKLIFYRMNRKDSLMGTYGEKTDSVFIAYEKTKEELENRGLLDNPVIRRSFQNKALGVYLYTMPYPNNYSQYEAFYLRMKEESFGVLDMLHMAEDDIYNARHKLQYASIQEMDAGDYLYWEFQGLIRKNNEQGQKLKASRQKNKDLRAAKRELNSEIKKLKKKNKELEKSNAGLERQLADSKKENLSLRASWSYRIGSIIMWLPGKLKRLVKRVH